MHRGYINKNDIAFFPSPHGPNSRAGKENKTFLWWLSLNLIRSFPIEGVYSFKRSKLVCYETEGHKMKIILRTKRWDIDNFLFAEIQFTITNVL